MIMYIDSNNFYKNVQDLYSEQRISIKWLKTIMRIKKDKLK